MQISKLKLMLRVKELTEEEILSLLINQRKNLVKKFIHKKARVFGSGLANLLEIRNKNLTRIR